MKEHNVCEDLAALGNSQSLVFSELGLNTRAAAHAAGQGFPSLRGHVRMPAVLSRQGVGLEVGDTIILI